MAFIDNSNFSNWPMGGMLEYELSILECLCDEYDVDLWGVSVDGQAEESIIIKGKEYRLNIYGNVHTSKKIIPNYWMGMSILNCKRFKEKKYDVIYAHTGSCFVGAVLGNKYSKNCVKAYHQHGLSYKTNYSLMVSIQKPFYWLSQRLADVVFLVTDEESAKEHVQKMKRKSHAKFIGIGSPINLCRFDTEKIIDRIERHGKEGIKSFIYVGRLSAEKNLKDLLLAFSIYKEMRSNNVVLNLLGDGPERESLIRYSQELGIADSILFLGAKKHGEVFEYLLNSDVFLISSDGEGVSIATLEAFASGLPVVCFDVPGLGKQNRDGITGIVVKQHSARAFAEAICDVEDNIVRYSRGCMEEAKKYSNVLISKKISINLTKHKG